MADFTYKWRKSGSDSEYKNGSNPTGDVDFDMSTQEYLDMLEKYKDSPYYNELLNNPYRYYSTYISPLSYFGEDTGLWTPGWRKNLESLQNSFNEYNSSVLEKINAYDINKPANQALLEQEAGLNPDITGISGSGAVSNADNPIASPDFSRPSGAETIGTLAQVGTMAYGFVNNVVGFAQSLQNLKSSKLDYAGKEISNVIQEISSNESASKFALNTLANAASSEEILKMSADEFSDYILDASSKMDYGGYSAKTGKLLKKWFRAYEKSAKDDKSTLGLKALQTQLTRQIVEDQKAIASVASRPDYDADLSEFVTAMAEMFSKPEYELYKMDMSARKREAQARTYKAGQDIDYNKTEGLGSAMGEAAKTSAEAQKASAEQNKVVEEMWSDIYQWCETHDNWYAKLGLIFLPLFRQMAGSLAGSVTTGSFTSPNYSTTNNFFNK